MGAGYLPICDPARDLTPVLRAKNNQVRANERTLLSEFSQDHYTETHPRLLERDDGRYVEAHGFLEWLSKYLSAQTETAIVFPDDLARAVRIATVAPATPTSADSHFESLTNALEKWFTQPLEKLPKELQQRIEQDFSPMPWDRLTGEQRRSLALQWDYQNDPATAKDRQHWWDFFERMDVIKAQIAQWDSVATPTAGELAMKEKRLAELRQELAGMATHERQDRGEYFPERTALEKKEETPVKAPKLPVRYIAYPKAMHQLATRLDATPEELAVWVWMGPDNGGIAAYVNANEIDPPPRFHFGFGGNLDYVAALMACWFAEEVVAQFEPTERYITGTALINRWSDMPGLQPEAFILAKIAESRLQDIHPMSGGTRGTFREYDNFPPLESGLFLVSQVEEVEAEDFVDVGERQTLGKPAQPSKAPAARGHPRVVVDDGDAKAARGSIVRREARKLDTQAMYKRWQKAYREAVKLRPNKSDTWYSIHIAKMDIAKGRDAETIRKHMKP